MDWKKESFGSTVNVNIEWAILLTAVDYKNIFTSGVRIEQGCYKIIVFSCSILSHKEQ